nr:hypothetical protein [Kibdelosporangium sp. MJ126-NF4]
MSAAISWLRLSRGCGISWLRQPGDCGSRVAAAACVQPPCVCGHLVCHHHLVAAIS